MNLHQLALSQYLFARINPAVWDAIIPMGPKSSSGTRNAMQAQIIKTAAFHLRDTDMKEELNELGKRLFSAGISAMDYDDDNWCPTVPFHIPHLHFGDINAVFNFSEVELNPQPIPPGRNYYGAILTIVAESVYDKDIASELKDISSRLMRERELIG